MQIRSLRLENFKRFTDLRLAEIPENTKLVLLVGANGSGKSSVFDAFEVLSRQARGFGAPERTPGLQHDYYAKAGNPEVLHVDVDDGSVDLGRKGLQGTRDGNGAGDWAQTRLRRLYGRSTLRIASRVGAASGSLAEILAKDSDSPRTFIDDDRRFQADATKYAVDFNHALRQPVFDGKQVDLAEVRDRLIRPINDALERVFGNVGPAPQMVNFREPETPGGPVQYFFRKGQHEFPYDVLSFGEKQVFAVLLNLFVRRDRLQDAVVYIDELDLHLNTALQFTLLQEIVEHWIPEGSQFWTASHSLGFLRYASQSARAVIFDFDALDFDVPQTLIPAPKDDSELLQVAVPAEYLPQLFAGRRLVYCEGKDTAKYNSIGIPDTIFVSGGSKFAVFGRARDGQMAAVIDRDWMTDEEIVDWERRVPSLRFLRHYSIENYLYHPDNLAEIHGAGFDRAAYVADLVRCKNEVYDDLNHVLGITRDTYPFKRDLDDVGKEAWRQSGRDIQRRLKSEELATFYPLFPMKDYAKSLPPRQNVDPKRLVRTRWFGEQIRAVLASVPLITGK